MKYQEGKPTYWDTQYTGIKFSEDPAFGFRLTTVGAGHYIRATQRQDLRTILTHSNTHSRPQIFYSLTTLLFHVMAIRHNMVKVMTSVSIENFINFFVWKLYYWITKLLPNERVYIPARTHLVNNLLRMLTMIDTITFRAILLLTKRLKQITCAHVDLSLF